MKSLPVIIAAGLLGGTAAVAPRGETRAGPLGISREGYGLIVEYETGGRSYYERRLKSPTWPGGASGVTVGLGYDAGYNTRAQVLADWQSLPAGPREALAGAAGVKGAAAKTRVAALRWITVPWATAENVFTERTLPRYGRLAGDTYPGLTRTHPHVQGAVLSLVFNRGASLSGPSRREMLAIRGHVRAGRIGALPAEVRAMKRLWAGKGLDGLLRRREAEARLIEQSIF